MLCQQYRERVSRRVTRCIRCKITVLFRSSVILRLFYTNPYFLSRKNCDFASIILTKNFFLFIVSNKDAIQKMIGGLPWVNELRRYERF